MPASKVAESKPVLTRAYRLDQAYERYRRIPQLEHLRYHSRFVPGTGSTRPRIMFVGEAPGQQENVAKKPFVGASGRVLDELLGSIDLKREHTFITNVVKYRPPGNRDPRGDEVAVSLPTLHEEIAILDPPLIVTLGRFALSVFYPKAHIANVHGSIIKHNGRILVPMFHPAVSLYNPGMRPMLFNDFAKIGAIV